MRNKFTVVKLVEDKHYELQTYIFKWRGFLKNEKKCSCPQISRNFFVPPKDFCSRFFFIRIYFIRISRLKMAKKLRIFLEYAETRSVLPNFLDKNVNMVLCWENVKLSLNFDLFSALKPLIWKVQFSNKIDAFSCNLICIR